MQTRVIIEVTETGEHRLVTDLSKIRQDGIYVLTWSSHSSWVIAPSDVCSLSRTHIDESGRRSRWRVTFRGGRGVWAFLLYMGLKQRDPSTSVRLEFNRMRV